MHQVSISSDFVAVHTGSTRHVGHSWPIVPAPGDCDDGEAGGMKIGRGNRSTRRKPTPAPLRPIQTSLDQTRARTRAAAVGSQWLTAWAMLRPLAEQGRQPRVQAATLGTGSLNLGPQVTVWPSYVRRHWVPFSSPTTRRAFTSGSWYTQWVIEKYECVYGLTHFSTTRCLNICG
jgi:hypothetical protein